MKKLVIFLFLILAPLIAFLFLASNPDDEPLAIIYTGAGLCKLKPCACSAESDLGGILRRDTVLSELKKKYPKRLLLDAGSSFREPTVQGRLAAIAYAKSLVTLKYDAVAISPADLVFGRQFIEENGKEFFFVSNMRWKNVESPLVVSSKTFKVNGDEVEVFAIVAPSDVYLGAQSDVEVEEPLEFLNKHARKDTLTIVLCSTSQENAKAYISHPDVEVVINAYVEAKIEDTPLYEFKDKKVLSEAGIFGSRVGVLKIRQKKGELLSVENEFIPLHKGYRDGQRVRQYYDDYESEVKNLFLQSLAGKPAFDKEKSPYIGSEACAKCHQKAYKIWEESKHSHAWESLKKVGKTFDPECINCHVIGFGKDGGFYSEEDSPHLIGVGCEACHGPAKAHAKEAKKGLPEFTRESCRVCHTNERSPAFEAKSYWKKIKHK